MKNSSSYKRIWVYATIIIISLLVTSCSKKSEKSISEKYLVINPKVANSTYSQEYVANIESKQHVELRARAKGFVENILVDEGSFVTKGQLLFILNSSQYRQEIAKAKANLASAHAELRQSEVDVKNAQKLSENNIISKSELEMALAKKDAIMGKIEEATAMISLANINLGFTQIKAPYSGFINRIPNKIGALIDEGTLLTTISSNNEIYAYFNVSETDYLNHISENNKNKKVNLKLANGTTFSQEGIIETIDGEIDQSTGNLSFRAKFRNTDNILKHGSSGKVLIKNTIKNAILIPQKCTFEVQEDLYVYVVDKDNKVRQRQIVKEMQLAEQYVVKEGLLPSDKVLFDGVQVVKEGEEIIPIYDKILTAN